MNKVELGDTLRICRHRKKLTQAKLAAILHIDRTCISRIESGEQEASTTLVWDWVTATDSHKYFASVFFDDEELREALRALDHIEKIREIVGMREG